MDVIGIQFAMAELCPFKRGHCEASYPSQGQSTAATQPSICARGHCERDREGAGLCSAHPVRIHTRSERFDVAIPGYLDVDRPRVDVASKGPLVATSYIVPLVVLVRVRRVEMRSVTGVDAEDYQRLVIHPFAHGAEALGRRGEEEVGQRSVEASRCATGTGLRLRSGTTSLFANIEAKVVQTLEVMGGRGVVQVLRRIAGGK